MHFVFLLLIFFIHVRPNEAILFMNFKKHYIFYLVTYYLEILNVIFVYCICHILPTKVKLVVWTS